MNILHTVAAQPGRLWRFLGVFQRPCLRILHALVAGLVLLQFLSSVFMESINSFSAWYHMWGGATLCVLAPVMTAYSLRTRGLRHFFPYLWGDVGQLKKDVDEALHFKMVGPRPRGLGAVVQGLGFGALGLAALSGLVWFWLYQSGSVYAETARSAHGWLVLLIIVYFIGHGSMALWHFAVWEEHVRQGD